MCIDSIVGWDQYQECEILGAFYSAPKIREILVRNQMKHTDFGSVRPEYLGPPWKVVHFDRSTHFGRSDRNVPFYLIILFFPVPLFCILLTRTIPRCAVTWVLVSVSGIYHFIGHVEFPKFQTGIFIEQKAFPLSYFAQSCCHCHHPSLQQLYS